LAEDGASCAQAGRKSFSKSNSLSGTVLISYFGRYREGATPNCSNQHGMTPARLQAQEMPAGDSRPPACYAAPGQTDEKIPETLLT
jgi:hypothetical protein